MYIPSYIAWLIIDNFHNDYEKNEVCANDSLETGGIAAAAAAEDSACCNREGSNQKWALFNSQALPVWFDYSF